MLHGSLKGVCTAELGVDHDEPDGPVHSDGQENQKEYSSEEACLTKCIRLAYDARAAVTSR